LEKANRDLSWQVAMLLKSGGSSSGADGKLPSPRGRGRSRANAVPGLAEDIGAQEPGAVPCLILTMILILSACLILLVQLQRPGP
jgi:hypothetical protein